MTGILDVWSAKEHGSIQGHQDTGAQGGIEMRNQKKIEVDPLITEALGNRDELLRVGELVGGPSRGFWKIVGFRMGRQYRWESEDALQAVIERVCTERGRKCGSHQQMQAAGHTYPLKNALNQVINNIEEELMKLKAIRVDHYGIEGIPLGE